jgi:hypothetical protein
VSAWKEKKEGRERKQENVRRGRRRSKNENGTEEQKRRKR